MGPKAAGHASGCLDSVPGPRADSCCVFYGWVILAVCISVKVVGTSGTLRMITFTVPGMMADPALAMPPSELSTLFSLGTLTGALGAPYLGGLIDRYGARTCLPLGCLMAAAALLTLSDLTLTASAFFFGCRPRFFGENRRFLSRWSSSGKKHKFFF